MTDLLTTTLGEVAEEITVGHVGSMATEYVDTGVPFLRSLNVEPLNIKKADLKYIRAEFHQKLKKSILRPGDVVVVRTGKPGAAAVIPGWLNEANCSDLVIIRPGAKLNPHWVAYYINCVGSRHVASHLVGAVQQHFNVESARSMPLSLPPKATQDLIASRLRLIDDKIELNRKMNETLEQMARAIFKSWFIDFDPVHAKRQGKKPFGMDDATAALFPDSFEPSELGEMPRGWEIGKASSILTIHRDSINPGDNPELTFTHYSLPAFDEGRIPKRELGAEIKSNKFSVRSNDVLISKLNPTTPRIWLTSSQIADNSVCSTEFMVVRPVRIGTAYLTCLLQSSPVQEKLVQTATGTSNSHQRTKPEVLLGLDAVVPPESIRNAFEKAVWPLLELGLQNIAESLTLSQTRDLLLPRLLSGEITVKEVTA